MSIHKCGIRVTTKLNNIEAIITGVSIRFNAISYELSYFNNNEYKQIWMNESEFISTASTKQKIGFIK